MWLAASLPTRFGLPAPGSAALRERRRRTRWLVLVEHAAFVAVGLLGVLVMAERGWTPARAPWLGLKIGLFAFLLVPLEAFHAWIHHAWIGPGLRATPGSPAARAWDRGESMDGMLRSLAVPLLAIAVPLLVWLSVAKPG